MRRPKSQRSGICGFLEPQSQAAVVDPHRPSLPNLPSGAALQNRFAALFPRAIIASRRAGRNDAHSHPLRLLYEGARTRKVLRLTLAGCDKRALVPHPTRAVFLTNTSFDGHNFGAIGGLGVNDPHYALAAKRFHPVTLSTAAHFLSSCSATPPPSSFHHTLSIHDHNQHTRKILATTFLRKYSTIINFINTNLKSNRSE